MESHVGGGPAADTEAQSGTEVQSVTEVQSLANESLTKASEPPMQKTGLGPLKLLKGLALQTSAAAGSAAGVVVGTTSAVVQSGTSLAVSAAAVTIEAGQTVFAVTQEAVAGVIGTAAQATSDSVNALSTTILQSTGAASELIGQQFSDLLTNAGKVVTSAGGTLSSSVDALAGDPNTSEGIHMQGLRIATGLLPVVGNAKAIGDARQKYKQATTLPEGDARNKLIHEARRDCLIASSLLSIEVATIGTTGAVDKALKIGNLVASVLNAGKTVREVTESRRWLPKIDFDTLSPRVDAALTFPPLREAMDIILRFNPEEAGSQ